MFKFETNGIKVIALYDSGAVTPVWAKNERMLKEVFPLAEKQERTCLLSGFGKGAVSCNIYKISEWALDNGEERYVIKNLHIIVNENPSIGCDMILSATMFSHADVMIRQKEEKSITIYFDKGTAPLWGKERMSITTWTQKLCGE